jgi:hypothetical protein
MTPTLIALAGTSFRFFELRFGFLLLRGSLFAAMISPNKFW